jgi:hypothetical protein
LKETNILKKILPALSVFIFFLMPEARAADAYITFHTSKNYLNHINKGYIAIDTRNFPLALKEFLTAKYINDELFAAYDGLGRVYELTKNNGKALESYQKALDLVSPKYGTDLIQKINIARANRETRKALDLYKIILSIRPEAGLQVLYGDKNQQDGNLSGALVNYKRAYKLQEDPEDYLKYLKIKYPNKEYERYIIRKYIQKSLRYPEAHFKAGFIDLKKKDYGAAIDEFTSAVSQITVPSVENKYINFLAQAHFNRAVSRKPINMESINKAIDLFEKFSNYEPRNTDILFKLADAYFYRDIAKMDAFDRENESLEKLNENIADISTSDSFLNKKFNTSFFDNTLDILRRIQGFPHYDPGVHYSLGNVYIKKAMIYHKGYYDREKYMNSAKVTAGNRAWDYYEKALEEYKTYINKSPNNNGTVYYDIGLLFYQASKLEANKNRLPITKENQKEYERWGPKFYKRDMLTRSVANFKTYMNYKPNAGNRAEVNNLIKEMQLAMVVNW